MKRSIDVIGAAVLGVLLLPLCLLVAALIRITMGSPVFFVQERPGLGGRPFQLVKFRTMAVPEPGRTAPDAERLTRVGRWLRATSLDELPELLSVLKGEMSLVGPRPLLMEYLPLYSERQARRHRVRPGITGWAQINGRNSLSWNERLEMDVWYVENRSTWLDLKILAATPWAVLRRKGITQRGHATMERFRGGSDASPGEDAGRDTRNRVR
jgi:sugar transferase EpsL